ncbi:hypothetical protein THAOC_03702, partial [Thalassiosira oceanica]
LRLVRGGADLPPPPRLVDPVDRTAVPAVLRVVLFELPALPLAELPLGRGEVAGVLEAGPVAGGCRGVDRVTAVVVFVGRVVTAPLGAAHVVPRVRTAAVASSLLPAPLRVRPPEIVTVLLLLRGVLAPVPAAAAPRRPPCAAVVLRGRVAAPPGVLPSRACFRLAPPFELPSFEESPESPELLVKNSVPTDGRLGAPTVAGGRASPSIASHNHPPSPAASYSERMRPLRPTPSRDAAQLSARATHSPASPRMKRLDATDHGSTTSRRVLSYSSTAATADTRLHAYPLLRRPIPASDERQAEPDRGGNHPPEAPGIAIRPSIAPPPTPSLLDQRDL